MDLVESEEAFRPALSYALGAALVCDSLEDAQELCFTKGEKVRYEEEFCFVIGCHVMRCSVLNCTVLYRTLWNSQQMHVMLMCLIVPVCV
jgi:SMC proteins Flexible Hinge Domain